jgi:hypothetical protein
MSNRRPPFEAIQAPCTWESAIAYARKGRPDLLATMVSPLVPEECRNEVLQLIANPAPQPKAPKRVFLEHDAEQIRGRYRALLASGAIKPAKHLADALGVKEGTIRDIVERKNAYRGEQTKKPHRRKRVTTKRR